MSSISKVLSSHDTHHSPTKKQKRSQSKKGIHIKQQLRKLPTRANMKHAFVKKKKKRYASYKCCFVGCNSNNMDKYVTFSRIPPPPDNTKVPTGNDWKEKWISFYRKSFHRAIVMDRVGLKFSDKKETKQLRICNKHKFKDLKKN